MERSEIVRPLQRIFAEVFLEPGIEIRDNLTPDMVPAWDSLSHIQMIAQVESEFHIRLKLKDLVRMQNVGDLISLIAAEAGQSSPSSA